MARSAMSPTAITSARAASASEGTSTGPEVSARWAVVPDRERPSSGIGEWVNAVAFSPDGAYLATALGRYNDNTIPGSAGTLLGNARTSVHKLRLPQDAISQARKTSRAGR